MAWVPWRQAWQEALYGGSGFYRTQGGPAAHFATSAQGAPGVGEVYAQALVALARREGLTRLVDLGAGRGELLTHVHAIAPDLALLGVDVADAPDLPEGAEWLVSPGGADLPAGLSDLTEALVVAGEWLDVVPCTVAERDAEGTMRVVLVDPATGEERLGDPLAGPDLAWCERDGHWREGPHARTGDRVEVGRTRDLAWRDLLSRVDGGVAVAIDYGHRREDRPASGTLTGFRHGRVVAPVPDGSCDLTAHVAMDSLDHDELVTQREALRRLGADGAVPARELASADPAAYLAGLTRSSATVALTATQGLGGFWWALARRGPSR